MAEDEQNLTPGTGAVVFPPLPAHETETTTPGGTVGGGTTEKKLSAEQVVRRGGRETAVQEEIAGQNDVEKFDRAKAQVALDNADAQVKQSTAQATETHNALADTQRIVDEARQQRIARQAELEKVPPVKFFRDGDTWGNARRGLALALGGIGDAMQRAAMVRVGQAPPTLDTVSSIIRSDLDEQKDHIDRLRQNVMDARLGEEDAMKWAASKKQDIALKGVLATQQLKALAEQRIAAVGVQGAGLPAQQARIKLAADEAKYQQDYVAPTTTEVSKKWEAPVGPTVKETVRDQPAVKPPPGDVRRAVIAQQGLDAAAEAEKLPSLSEETLQKLHANALRAAQADEAIKRGEKGADYVARAGRAAGITPENRYSGIEGKEKQAALAGDRLTTLYAQALASRGGMTPEQVDAEMTRHGLSPGMSPAQQRANIAYMKTALQRMMAGEGTAGASVSAVPPAAPAPEPAAEVPAAQKATRDKVIQAIKAEPDDRRVPALKARYNITDAELQ